jgi:hypothetical protein
LRPRPVELKPQEWALCARGFTSSPQIDAAYHLRADWTELFARVDTKAGAKCALRSWYTRVHASGLAACASWRGTIVRWMEKRTYDGQGRQTSGGVEGWQPPRERAQEAGRRDRHRRPALPPTHARPAWRPTRPSSLTSRPRVVHHVPASSARNVGSIIAQSNASSRHPAGTKVLSGPQL